MQIIESEKKKRQEIMGNFENHIAQIKEQIKADHIKMNEEHDLVKENNDLKE